MEFSSTPFHVSVDGTVGIDGTPGRHGMILGLSTEDQEISIIFISTTSTTVGGIMVGEMVGPTTAGEMASVEAVSVADLAVATTIALPPGMVDSSVAHQGYPMYLPIRLPTDQVMSE